MAVGLLSVLGNFPAVQSTITKILCINRFYLQSNILFALFSFWHSFFHQQKTIYILLLVIPIAPKPYRWLNLIKRILAFPNRNKQLLDKLSIIDRGFSVRSHFIMQSLSNQWPSTFHCFGSTSNQFCFYNFPMLRLFFFRKSLCHASEFTFNHVLSGSFTLLLESINAIFFNIFCPHNTTALSKWSGEFFLKSLLKDSFNP